MRPAASLIIFTTLSGLGFGLATVIGTGLLKATNAQWAIIHGFVSLGFISIGIIASTWHLGHPERAWRALSQWRSSWLSREGVLAGATVMLLIIYVADQIYSGTVNAWLGAGLALLSLATIFATAMIYASLKPIPLWHHPLTPVNFVLWAIAGGLLLAATLATWQGINHSLPPPSPHNPTNRHHQQNRMVAKPKKTQLNTRNRHRIRQFGKSAHDHAPTHRRKLATTRNGLPNSPKTQKPPKTHNPNPSNSPTNSPNNNRPPLRPNTNPSNNPTHHRSRNRTLAILRRS